MKKICVLNYGCISHVSQFQQLIKNLENEYEITLFPNRADVIVEYFCFICGPLYETIAEELTYIKHVRKTGSTYIIVGCAVDVFGDDFFQEYSDYSFPSENWVDSVVQLLTRHKLQDEYYLPDNKHYFDIDIVGGCVRKGGYCTFCKQNYLHRRVKSMSIDEVVALATKVTQNSNVTNIILSGLNTCNYGIDIGDRSQKLHLLIRKVSEIPTVKQLTVVSLTAGDMYEELIEELATNPKIDEISLGFQSGSDTMLKIMNIHTTVEQLQYLIGRLSHKPNRTIMVIGHPGETDKTIQESIDFIKKNNLWYVQAEIFENSIGLPSNEMVQLPKEEQKRYLSLVKGVIRDLARDFVSQLIDTTIECYYESYEFYKDENRTYIWLKAVDYKLNVVFFPAEEDCDELKEIPYGAKVKCRIMGHYRITPPHVSVIADELEVIECE